MSKSAKITQLVSGGTGTQSQAMRPRVPARSHRQHIHAFRAELVDQILWKGWGWDTRSHSRELCCSVEFPCTNACAPSLERVLGIHGLEWLPKVKCVANFSASCTCSWVRPRSV